MHAELACLISATAMYIVARSSSSSSPTMGFDFGPCPWHLGFTVGAPAVIISESLPISLRPVGPVCNSTALGRPSGDNKYVGDIEVEEDIDEVDVNNVVQVCAVVSSATTSSAHEPGTRGAKTAPKSEDGLWVMALNCSCAGPLKSKSWRKRMFTFCFLRTLFKQLKIVLLWSTSIIQFARLLRLQPQDKRTHANNTTPSFDST